MGIVDGFANLLRRHYAGVLATHSTRQYGYPFASRVPYCCDAQGNPLLAVSALAEHTNNLRADARVSLSVWDESEDVQAAARTTVLGDIETAADEADACARYVAHFPAAAGYLQELDFTLYRLRLRSAHYIAGFADVHWLEAAAIAGLPAWDADENELARRCIDDATLQKLAPQGTALVGIDPQGLTLRSVQALRRVVFAQTLQKPQQITAALEQLTA